MAPTLLGMHRDFLCPGCTRRFAMGMDENGRIGRPVCPNCGLSELDHAPVSDGLGDRLLVQKFLYDLRPPKRWEVVVFQNPADPSQAYVKRIVALPGESVLLSGGDVMIDGAIARKTLAEARAMAIPVYDHDFLPRDIARYPRFLLRRGDFRNPLPSAWVADGSRFVRKPSGTETDRPDWIEYRHWRPDRGAYGPIYDYTPYNGADVPGENRIKDLLLTARVAPGPGTKSVVVRIDSGSDRFFVTLPIGDAAIEVRRNGKKQVVRELGPRFAPDGISSARPGPWKWACSTAGSSSRWMAYLQSPRSTTTTLASAHPPARRRSSWAWLATARRKFRGFGSTATSTIPSR